MLLLMLMLMLLLLHSAAEGTEGRQPRTQWASVVGCAVAAHMAD